MASRGAQIIPPHQYGGNASAMTLLHPLPRRETRHSSLPEVGEGDVDAASEHGTFENLPRGGIALLRTEELKDIQSDTEFSLPESFQSRLGLMSRGLRQAGHLTKRRSPPESAMN